MPEKIRIAHIVEATAGGTRRHVFDLISHTDFSKYDVTLICATRRDVAFLRDIELLRSMGVRVEIVEMGRSISPSGDVVSLSKIYRVLRKVRPMLVHTHSSKAGILGRVAARLSGVRAAIHTPHVFAFQMRAGLFRKWFYLELERFAARLTEHIICVSEDEKKIAEAARVISTEKLHVVRNGIDMPPAPSDVRPGNVFRAEIGIGPSDVLIGTLGRFYEQKGLEILLAAAPGIFEKVPDSRIVIAAGEGDPGVRRRVAKALEDGDILGRCEVIVPPEDTSRFLAALDVFVLPSLWEGFPYVLLEAMAVGLPVVASRVGGVPELLRDEIDGLLVPAGDVQALMAAVCRLAADWKYAAELGGNAAKRVRDDFSMEEMLRRTFKVYDEALDVTGQKALQ